MIRILALLGVFYLITPQFAAAQKKETKPAPEQKVVTGTVLLGEKTAPNGKTLVANLNAKHKAGADSLSTADKTIIFSVPGATVMIAYLDYPISPSEIQAASSISWLWKNAEQEAAKHQAQAVISIIGTSDKTLDLYKLFTKTAATLLDQTNSLGIYMNSQFLLLSKGYYLEAARNMSEQSLPLYCWVYFGLLQDKGLSSGYTWGLKEFGMEEMEFVESERPLQDAHAILYDATMYAVRNNGAVKDGAVIPINEDMKMKATLSAGRFLEEKTLKLQ